LSVPLIFVWVVEIVIEPFRQKPQHPMHLAVCVKFQFIVVAGDGIQRLG